MPVRDIMSKFQKSQRVRGIFFNSHTCCVRDNFMSTISAVMKRSITFVYVKSITFYYYLYFSTKTRSLLWSCLWLWTRKWRRTRFPGRR